MATTIITRAGKGSALTNTELDANFTNLQATADAAGGGLSLTTVSKTTTYSLVVGDAGKCVSMTGTWTLGATTTSMTDGWTVELLNAGTGIITFSPGFDGLGTNLLIYPGERFLLTWNGSAWRTLGRAKRVVAWKSATVGSTVTTFDVTLPVDAEARRLELSVILATNVSPSTDAPRASLLVSGSAASLDYRFSDVSGAHSSGTATTDSDAGVTVAPLTSTTLSVGGWTMEGIYTPYARGYTGQLHLQGTATRPSSGGRVSFTADMELTTSGDAAAIRFDLGGSITMYQPTAAVVWVVRD